MTYVQPHSMASSLFNALEPIMPEVYLYYIEGKRKLARVGFNGSYAELGRPYELSEMQSVEMALGGMDYTHKYRRIGSSDMPRKGTYPKGITLENIVYGSDAVTYNHHLVYVVCLKNICPINEDNIVKGILTSDNLLAVNLGENIKAHAYVKQKDEPSDIQYLKKEVPALVH